MKSKKRKRKKRFPHSWEKIDCSVTMKTIATRVNFNRSRTTVSLVTFLKASQSVTAMPLKFRQDYHSSDIPIK